MLQNVKPHGGNIPHPHRSTVWYMPSRRHTSDRFRANLKAAMSFHGLKPEVIAKNSGVSLRMVYSVLRGENRPTIDVANALAAAAGYTGWELLVESFTPAHRVAEMVTVYNGATDAGRQIMDAITRRELEDQHSRSSKR